MEYVLTTTNLTKVFKGKEVVSNVNMKIKKGEIYGFLGPNGAGKTTIMKLMTNLLKPTSGEITVFNNKLSHDSYEMFRKMGIIIENPIFYENLTCRQSLEMHCDYIGAHHKQSIDEVLNWVNLKGVDNTKTKTLSLGMKQRLAIARAIVAKPEILILDEPINGLDPNGIKELRDLFKLLSSEYGMTILISSHILSEIEHIADTIGIISKGNLVEEISMADLKKKNGSFIEVSVDSSEKASHIFNTKMKLSNFKIFDGNLIKIYNAEVAPSKISEILIQNDIAINSIAKKQVSLEDYYLKLTERGVVNG